MLDNTSQKIYGFALGKLSQNDIPVKKLQEKLIEKFITKNKKFVLDFDYDEKKQEILEKISEIIELLKSQKYLDDIRFCENFIRWRCEAMPRGKYMIIQELLLKKIDSDLAEKMCEKLISYQTEKKMCKILFIQKLEKLQNKYLYSQDSKISDLSESEKNNIIKQKLFAYLAGKQFSYSLMTEIWEDIIQ